MEVGAAGTSQGASNFKSGAYIYYYYDNHCRFKADPNKDK